MKDSSPIIKLINSKAIYLFFKSLNLITCNSIYQYLSMHTYNYKSLCAFPLKSGKHSGQLSLLQHTTVLNNKALVTCVTKEKYV